MSIHTRFKNAPVVGVDIEEMFPCDRYPFNRIQSAQMFRNLDIIFDRPVKQDYSMETIKNDDIRRCYILLIEELYERSMVKDELPLLLSKVAAAVIEKKKKSRKTERTYMSDRYRYIETIDFYCPFEPAWHMKARGDYKKMNDGTKNGYWRYLKSLYTDPSKSAEPIPDWVVAGYSKNKGLEKLVIEARYDGQEYMRRKYGDDWKKECSKKETYVTISDNPDFISGNLLELIRNA